MSDSVMDLLTGPWKARAVTSAARAGVFDSLSQQPADSAQLAHRLDLHRPTLVRLLRFLEDVDLLATAQDGTYHLTAVGATLVSDHPSSLRRLAELYEEHYFDTAWREFSTGLRTGEAPFAAAFGMPVFEYLAEHPQEASRYTAAIGEGAPYGRLLAETAELDSPRHIVDVGGGNGRVLADFLQVYTQARGTLLDRPDVVSHATDILSRAGVAERAMVVGGDFFEEIPSGADVYLLSRVLHNWDNRACIRLLQAINDVAGQSSQILIVERMLRDGAPCGTGQVLASLFDLHMFVMTEGRERTEAEYASMLSAAGLLPLPAAPLMLGFSMLRAVPPEGGRS